MPDDTLGELVTRLADSGKAFARAEVAVVKATALARIAAWKPAAILFVAALVIALAAIPVLIAALGMTIAIWLGAAAGLAIAAVIAFAIAGLLAWLGNARLKGKVA